MEREGSDQGFSRPASELAGFRLTFPGQENTDALKKIAPRERPLSSTRRTTNKGGGQDRVDVAQQGRRQQTGRRTPRLSARRAAFDAPKGHLFEPDCPSRCCAHEMRATAIGPPHGTNAYSQFDLTTRPARPSSCFCRKPATAAAADPHPRRCRLVTGIVETKQVCRKAWLFAASAVRVIPRRVGQMRGRG